jgi:predicted protein tyrosine phosphatase
MRPYQNIKLDPVPDVADGKAEGRAARVVNLPGKGGKARSNQAPRKKAAARRLLKHRDKARTARRIQKDNEPGRHYVGQASYAIEQPREPKIIVQSHLFTERMPAYSKPWACVSITGPFDHDARVPSANRVGILRLKFDDVNGPSDPWFRRTDRLFSPEQAQQVLDFAASVWHRVDIIHIHCWAGISRSSATAAALSRIYFGDDGKFVEGPVYRPNKLVYQTILNQLPQHKQPREEEENNA